MSIKKGRPPKINQEAAGSRDRFVIQNEFSNYHNFYLVLSSLVQPPKKLIDTLCGRKQGSLYSLIVREYYRYFHRNNNISSLPPSFPAMNFVMAQITEHFQVVHSVAPPLAVEYDMMRRGALLNPCPAPDTSAFVLGINGIIQRV